MAFLFTADVNITLDKRCLHPDVDKEFNIIKEE
ncbi:MAG: hypothetical protein ACI9LG_003181 [Moritella dasanensis]|jgi:hypothetical protein